MEEKYFLDNLNQHNVWIRKEHYLNGIVKPVQITRKSYSNSLSGRIQITEELTEQQQNAIFAVWGDAPTIDEDVTD